MVCKAINLVLVLSVIQAGHVTVSLTEKDIATCLDSHNILRALHVDTGSLVWDEELAADAQVWADYLADQVKLKHDETDAGENLFRETYYHDRDVCTRAAISWYSEISAWDFSISASTGNVTGHFTQMVWSKNTRLGVGIVSMDAPGYDPMWGFKRNIVVARYGPGGNVRGQYADYVKPRITGAVTPTIEELMEELEGASEEEDEDSSKSGDEKSDEGKNNSEESEKENDNSEQEKGNDDSSSKKKDKKGKKNKNKGDKKNKKNKKNKKGKKGN